MTLLFKSIIKLFEPGHTNLDSRLWVQKVILKKHINKLSNSNKF